MIKIEIKKELFGSNKEMMLDVALEIKEGEFLALSGVSGSGKTTLLRILAGFEDAKGVISVDDEIWLDAKTTLAPQRRAIGFVFQDYALFNNMSVLQNLLYVKKRSPSLASLGYYRVKRAKKQTSKHAKWWAKTESCPLSRHDGRTKTSSYG